MSFLSKRTAAPPPVEFHDYDDVNYEVLVHVPLGSPLPSAATVNAAVCAGLSLPPERVQTRVFFPWMGG